MAHAPVRDAHLRDDSIALLTVDRNGVVTRRPLIHPLGEKAPLKLAVIQEDRWPDEGGARILAEIGVSRTHPYRKNTGLFEIKGRDHGEPRITDRQTAAIAPYLRQLFWNLLAIRASELRWKNPEESNWWHRRLQGIGISVSERDASLLRLFNEWETLSPVLEWRIRDMAKFVNYYKLRPVAKGYPRSWGHMLRDFKRNKEWTPLLRPHILADIALRVHGKAPMPPRRQRFHAKLFLEFFAENGLITPRGFQEAMGHLSRRSADASAPMLDFRILPREAAKWRVHKNDGLPVAFREQVRGDCWSVRVYLPPEAWWARAQLYTGVLPYPEGANGNGNRNGNGNHHHENNEAEGFDVPVLSLEELAELGGQGIDG